MRDGDVMELLPKLEREQKYECEISDCVVYGMIDFLVADLAFSCLMYLGWAQ